MKHVGRGRIAVWEGASLWAFEVPASTTLRRSTEEHAHHAIQLTVAVEGDFAFRIGPDVVGGPAVLIAPDVRHAYVPSGRNAMVFIDPEGKLGVSVLHELGGRAFIRLDPERFADVAMRLNCIWQGTRPDNAALVDLGRALAARLADSGVADRIDRRIARVIGRLAGDLELSAGAAADVACLSRSRFSHLFVKEIGLPYQTYVLWRRLTIAVDGIAAGASLTTAAHDAGFADSAHFSRTFMRMFGVPASLLLMI